MRIITAIKAFFKALFNGDFAAKLAVFMDGQSNSPSSERKDLKLPEFEPGTVGVLALLQREGRLVDFLQEDIESAPDAQIGAVVKSTVYKGCRKALSDYLKLEPVRSEEEGEEVTVEAGFSPGEIRLVGKVEGDPPFKGILRHKGWRLVKANLPSAAVEEEAEDVICPAEVELT